MGSSRLASINATISCNLGWLVPIDTSVLGRLTLERLPQIEQVFIGGVGQR